MSDTAGTPNRRQPRAEALLAALVRPVDAAGPAAFRILFGLVMFGAMVRFLLSDWMVEVYERPTFFFKYYGFAWVEALPLPAMKVLYVALAVLALCIALGFCYRLSAALFFLGFTYVELIDVTNYLNHYYLVTLLSGLMIFLPLHRTWSLDARLRPGLAAQTIPAWCLYLLRFQIGVVYVFAGLAKLTADWLLHAQPLQIWLLARTETPLIGSFLDELWVAYAASWFGFLYDTTIVLWLSWRRSRPYAFAVVIGFHFLTGVFFNIGVFPFIMTTSALVFFSPSWPRRLLRRASVPAPAVAASSAGSLTTAQRLGLTAALVFCLLQVLVPLRHYAYPGNVLWDEQGMRWSWKVMVREKQGAITFYVHFPQTGKTLEIAPRRYLTPRQEREMAGQPDLIHQLARHIAADLGARGYGPVEVRVEARVSLNGRPAQLLIDPERDLAAIAPTFAPADWILPEPAGPPIRLRKLASSRPIP